MKNENTDGIYKNYEPAVVSENDSENIEAYWFAFSDNSMLIKQDKDKHLIPICKNIQEFSISTVRTQYLGLLKGKACYSAELQPNTSAPAGFSFITLRALFGILDQDLFLLAGKAYQIVAWDQTHQFCGRCGSPTQTQPGERAKICPQCGFISYPRICPAVITAVIKEDKILLAHANAFKGDMHSLIAGFLEPGETLEECVARELMEEVKIKVKNIKYFSSQPWPFPNSMMIGFTAEYESGEISVDGKEIKKAGWFSADALPELPSEVSIARKIINWYVSTRKVSGI